MEIVDVRTQFGPLPMASSDLAVDDLLGLMQKHNVRAAYTLSTLGLLLDPVAGNMATKAACGDHPELLPVATLNPTMYFGDADISSLSGQYRLVRFAPAMQNYPLDFAPFAELAGSVGASLPIMVDVAKPGDLSDLERAVGDLPKPLIVAGIHAGLLAEAVAILKRRTGWMLETSQLLVPGGIKLAADTLGAERILFGTSAPLQPVAGAIQTIRLSGLQEAALTQIFGANARRILG
jgi:hypothetical protein